MDIMEENNPLQIYPATYQRAFKNSVGRPRKCKEINFSPEPKSIIGLLLKKEKEKKICIHQKDGDTTTHSTKKHNRKIWTCQHCLERVFHRKSEYKQHIMMHTKIYKCDVENCSYLSKFPSNLKTHKRTHVSDQPYVCDECTFRTKFISSLKTHKRLHRTERPFNCQYCEYKCNSCSNLKKHCSRKHVNIIKDIQI